MTNCLGEILGLASIPLNYMTDSYAATTLYIRVARATERLYSTLTQTLWYHESANMARNMH